MSLLLCTTSSDALVASTVIPHLHYPMLIYAMPLLQMVIGFALAAMSMDQADRDGDHDVSSWKGGYPASPPQHVDYKQTRPTSPPTTCSGLYTMIFHDMCSEIEKSQEETFNAHTSTSGKSEIEKGKGNPITDFEDSNLIICSKN
ncbi:hypothetical protein HGM15179_015477 [Zosterops borbonicus]|uniref:Uncharacterized protein n=1 Tax=Zosterops borbonicus TaxID=364589 RepID=A0A8K1G4G3_9PASS|nr:hypothetical protein HGM15179_015477 [Zosterops borbonicus]